MFIHDIIKIKYVNLGYLPNIPYHLVSDEEMFDAFIMKAVKPPNPDPESTFFFNMYPFFGVPSDTDTVKTHQILVDSIVNAVRGYQGDPTKPLPDWIYSYMIGEVVGPHSDKRDIHDVISPLGADNPDDDFDDLAAQKCYQESQEYLMRTMTITDIYGDFEAVPPILPKRPPTMFGEPHVIKSLRLKQQKL